VVIHSYPKKGKQKSFDPTKKVVESDYFKASFWQGSGDHCQKARESEASDGNSHSLERFGAEFFGFGRLELHKLVGDECVERINSFVEDITGIDDIQIALRAAIGMALVALASFPRCNKSGTGIPAEFELILHKEALEICRGGFHG
jgi:hypothetical protein